MLDRTEVMQMIRQELIIITNRLQIGIDALLTDDKFVTIAIAHAILIMPVDNDKDKTEILESQMSGTIGIPTRDTLVSLFAR